MIRRFNYTGRKRINRSEVKFVLHPTENGYFVFDASLDFAKHELPPDAVIWVEAYRQTKLMRFKYGNIDSIEPPRDRKLTEFDTSDEILFRVKVTSSSNQPGKLLAEADRIPFHLADEDETDDKREPLLPVVPQDLGHEITRLDFDDKPRLLINSSVEDYRSLALSPVFTSLVYPLILREILVRVLLIDKYDTIDDREEWRSNWLRFALSLPGISELPSVEDEDRILDWIDDAIAAFARRCELSKVFRTYWKEGQ